MLKNMKIGKKLIATFILVAFISSIGSVVGFFMLQNMDSGYGNALIKYGFAQGDVGRLSAEFNNSRSILQEMIIAADQQTIQSAVDNLDKSGAAIDQDLAEIQKTLVGVIETGHYNMIQENLEAYKDLKSRVVELALENNDEQANRLLVTEGAPIFDNLTTSINTLFSEKTSKGDQISADLTAQRNTTTVSMLAILVITLVLSLIIALAISRSISRPVKDMVEAARKMAKGDLQVQVSVNSRDEIGQLSAAFTESIASIRSYIADITNVLGEIERGNLTVLPALDYNGDYADLKDSCLGILASFNDTLGQINQASEQVSSGASQISDSSQALAQGATEQASSVEELAASISEISAQVQQNAAHATDASRNVNNVRAEIEISNRHMGEMVGAMSQISESSGQIGKIIKTIEDIAFQTNILALNAAVEAARAGAAGKGFAVVADEVRNLASKSAEAAKNTTDLIENSMKQVKNGTRIANETANSLLLVVDNTKEVADIVDQISRASKQQADSIGQITLGVEQISSVVQTNSATAEESAAASEELSGQAQTMKELVGKFKLNKMAL
ncbi:methyl-accepting chemotaxis protein [Caproiciproducens sp. R1]|uniref:methyl-accepting chemotaxis protein n=1 Tax=Caproiciproducens sp. R1 TaxID=3435000 RepID=UPI00403416FB